MQYKAIPNTQKSDLFLQKLTEIKFLNQILLEQNIYYLGINHLIELLQNIIN